MAWDKDKPAGTTDVSQVDNDIRDNNAALETSLGQEHQFAPGDTGGEHLEGSGRAWVDVAANLALRDSARGRLFIETDTNTMRYGDAAGVWRELSPRRNVAKYSLTPEVPIQSAAVAWVDIGAGIVHVDITNREHGRLMLTATITVKQLVAGHAGYLRFAVDGIGVSAGVAPTGAGAVIEYEGRVVTITLTRLVEDTDNGISLAAGAHTVTVQWMNDAAGGTMELTIGANLSLHVEEV